MSLGRLKARQLAGLAAIASVAVVSAFLLGVSFGPLQPFMGRWSFLILEFAGAFACLWRAWRVRSERLAWSLIGIGLFLWALGDAYYRVVLYTMDTPPVPSPADVLWISFYLFAYAGIGLLIRERAGKMSVTVWIDGVIAALAVAALVAAVVFQAVLESIGGAPVSTAFDLSYPLADMLLMAFIAAGLAITGWRLDRTWMWLAASLALFAISDSVYLYQVARGTYVDGGLNDGGWALAMLFAGAAAWQVGGRAARLRGEEGWRSIVFPICFAFVVIGVETYDHFHRVTLLAVVLGGACLLAVLVRLAITFAQNLRMLEASREDASTDPLTGLFNRRRLDRHLAAALAPDDASPSKMLMLLDLNGFKLYNDTFGHTAGDALLARLGGQLGEAVAGRGHAYRMGGDEFCALVDVRDERPEQLAATIASSLSEHGEGFMIDASFGAIAIPQEAADSETALRLVDQRMYAQKQRSRVSAREQSSNVLTRALLERSPALTEHLSAVSEMAVATGRELGLDEAELETLQIAGRLHDIGKVAIPDAILHKPGPLDDEERAYVQRHSVVGERIISAAPALINVAELVRSVHERYDGGGYPDSLARDQIPLGSRILAVCDAYHAMTTGQRPYRKPVPHDDAIAELRRGAGSQFDPLIVRAFLRTHPDRARAEIRVPATITAALI
jgi:diguanylate cyclase (GGDEF)-like protein